MNADTELSGDHQAGRPATIRFLTPEEGGRITPARSGVRPQLALDDSFTSCIVEAIGAGDLPAGVQVDVRIKLLFPWMEQEFCRLRTVRLYEGNKLVATGEFFDQPNDDHEPSRQPG